jgi:hypothetical protein
MVGPPSGFVQIAAFSFYQGGFMRMIFVTYSLLILLAVATLIFAIIVGPT